MFRTSFVTRVAAAAAALFATTGAFAEGTFTPEIGIGHGSGKQIGVPGDRTTWKLDDGNGGTADSKTLTDGLLSLGLQYRIHTHYAMEVRVSHLTSSGVTSTTLQAQFPF
jgi:hypothetical protein